MPDESMFRFVLARANGRAGRGSTSSEIVFEAFEEGRPTDFAASLGQLIESGAASSRIEKTVAGFRGSDGYVDDVQSLRFDVAGILSWAQARSSADLSEVDVADELADVLGAPLSKIAGSKSFKEAFDRLSDSVLAEAFDPRAPVVDRELLVMVTKLGSLIRGLASGRTAPRSGTLGRWLSGTPLRIPPLSAPQERPSPDRAPSPPAAPDPRHALREELEALEAAHRELAELAMDQTALYWPESAGDEDQRLTTLEEQVHALGSIAEGCTDDPAASKARRALSRNVRDTPGVPTAFHLDALERVSEGTKQVLTGLELDPKRIHPTGVVEKLESKMMALTGMPVPLSGEGFLLNLGGWGFDRGGLLDLLGWGLPGTESAPEVPEPHDCEHTVGVGDLLIVRQTLKAYELGNFAHVENVLAGESRLREHRRLNVREEIVGFEEERETERERDLQSTERNELQTEAEKTVSSQFELEAGVQISGSYGPTVSFSTNLGTSFSTTSEESQRKAVTYSKEVTEKTAERVRERVKREQRRRMLEEVEELNRHAVDNSSPGHVRGIYRWLTKIYDAQIFHYGQRMMYELILPEPAAFFLYATLEHPPTNAVVQPPVPPAFGVGGHPLRPSHLTRTNYVAYVSQYQVRNVPTPPPEFQHVAYFDKHEGNERASILTRANKLQVPPGYQAYGATVMAEHAFSAGVPSAFHVFLGGREYNYSSRRGVWYQDFEVRYSELSVAVDLIETWGFTLGIDVHCRLTSEGFAKWQQAAYDAIMEAYEIQRADYQESQAAQAIQEGIPILGRNPLENRHIEREELKKLAIMSLSGTVEVARDSMLRSDEPLMDLRDACAHGPWIKFFETAFEWPNMLYVFYPYFWGRKARWSTALHFTDPDHDFAAFLKAGAVRVQLPVRPGFEKAVAYFSQFGDIWEGEDPPLMDDDLYVPIIDEITENLGGLDDGVPYPEGSVPWEVKVPTSLVVVQDLEEVPNIRDGLTGESINLR